MTPLKRANATAVISRMMLDITGVAHEFGYRHKHLGANLELMYVALAVHVGTHEGRPMTATKISHFIGVPRTNVMRALKQLEELGRVTTTARHEYQTDMQKLGTRSTGAAVRKMCKSIHHACLHLKDLGYIVNPPGC